MEQVPISNSPASINQLLLRYNYLKKLGVDGWDLNAINPNRCKFLARKGRQSTPQSLRRNPAQKRYQILVCFLKETLINVTDLILDMYDECIRNTHHRAHQRMEAYRLSIQRVREENTRILQPTVAMVVDERIESDRRPLD